VHMRVESWIYHIHSQIRYATLMKTLKTRAKGTKEPSKNSCPSSSTSSISITELGITYNTTSFHMNMS
jgi:hypothetical protein